MAKPAKLTPAQARVVRAMAEGKVLVWLQVDGRFAFAGQARAVSPRVARVLIAGGLCDETSQSEHGKTYRLTPAGRAAARDAKGGAR